MNALFDAVVNETDTGRLLTVNLLDPDWKEKYDKESEQIELLRLQLAAAQEYARQLEERLAKHERIERSCEALGC